jgi:FixJ family two-component response regulator
MGKERGIVYVIDSDESVRRAFARLIRTEGFDAETFRSIDDFLAGPRRKERSCVVMDFPTDNVPDSALMQRLAGCGVLTPIVVVSTSDSSRDRNRARQLGAVSFFRKPVDDRALLDSIRWAVSWTWVR